MLQSKNKKDFCFHDYKNAIEVGKIDHMCPKCRQMLDPGEWFLMNSFEFIDVTSEKVKKELRKRDRETSKKVLNYLSNKK